MKLALTLLLLSSTLALESLVEFLKPRIDKSKFPNLNMDKFIEVINAKFGSERVEEWFFAVFCRFEDKAGCRANYKTYLDSYDVKTSQQQLAKGEPWALKMAAYKDKADCNKQLTSICKGANEAKCKKAAAAMCEGFFSHKDAVQYGTQYVAYREQYEKIHDEWAHKKDAEDKKQTN